MKMKSDDIIRKYGRDVASRLRECDDEEQMKAILKSEGFSVSESDISTITELIKTMGGEMRELSLDELDHITGGTII